MPTFDDIQEIHTADSAEDTQYVVRTNNVIVALRLRLPKNPRAKQQPAQVWVGDGPIVAEWGKRLSQKRGRVRLYVAPSGTSDEYEDLGDHKVDSCSTDVEKLAAAKAVVGHGLSRIVFLKKV